MTAISAFIVRGIPCVFSDLLITGEAHTKALFIPAAANSITGYFEYKGRDFVRLQQKLFVIGTSCCVAWSGSRLKAEELITRLKLLDASCELTAENFQRTAEEVSGNGGGLAIVGWLVKRSGIIEPLNFGALDFEVPRSIQKSKGLSDRIFVAGTGGGHLKRFLLEEQSALLQGAEGSSNEARSIILTMAAGLYGAEHFTGLYSHLAEEFGGGYEAALFERDRFSKLDSTTFIGCRVRVRRKFSQGSDPKKADLQYELAVPTLVLKQKYINGDLYIRAMNSTTLQNGSVVFVENKFRICDSSIPPPDFEQIVPYESPRYVFNLQVDLSASRRPVPLTGHLMMTPQSSIHPISVHEVSGDRRDVKIPFEFIDRLENALRHFFARDKRRLGHN